MAVTKDFDAIFAAFYSQYRMEATTPASSSDEYTIAMALANEAVNYWEEYDGTYWKELFDTNQNDGSGSQTIVTNDTTYAAPTNMKEWGGNIRIKNSSGNIVQQYPIIDLNEVQFKDQNATFAYFTSSPIYYSTGTASQSTTTITGSGTTWTAAMVGMEFVFATGESATITAFTSTTSLTASVSQTVASSAYNIRTTGFTLNLNPAPTSSLNGMDIDYDYYKKATEFTTGDTRTEVPNPYFIVHRMLASRFRGSRNPFRGDAKADAENAVRIMQLKNNSGTWANPWTMADTSGSTWGQ